MATYSLTLPFSSDMYAKQDLSIESAFSLLEDIQFNSKIQGLDGLDYKEHIDYDLVESTNPAFGKAIVRVNVFRNHRQV